MKKYDKIIILFISQGTIGKELSKFATDLRGMLEVEKYEIIYKLHPGEYDRWKAEYPWLINKGILVVDQNIHDMHYYFSQADIQVGIYSTALYEGLAYHLRTYVLPLYGHHYLEELVELGIVKIIRYPNELLECISIDDLRHQLNIDRLWQPNSLNNMIMSINAIIKKT